MVWLFSDERKKNPLIFLVEFCILLQTRAARARPAGTLSGARNREGSRHQHPV